MPIAWYIVPYKRVYDKTHVPGSVPCRVCEMNDYTHDIIYVYGGAWTETEILGNRAVVKVRCRPAVLNFLDTVPGFRRLPKDRLNQSLADLPSAIIRRMHDDLLDAGYSNDEIHAWFGGHLEDFTLGDYLRFAARRRRKPRWDKEADAIVLDGPVQRCRPIESVDDEVQE